MKIVKWFLIVVAVVIFIVVATAVAVPILYKDQLLAVVKKEANKNINGKVSFDDVNISLFKHFPKLTLSLDKLAIVGTDQFEGDTLTSISRLDISVNLLSTIKALRNDEALEIRSISLVSPHIYARILEDGTSNWDIAPDSEKETVPKDDKESGGFQMSLNSFQIKDGIIEYDDAILDMRLLMEGYNQSLKGDFTEDVFDLNISGVIEKLTVDYGGVQYLTNVRTKIKAGIEIDNKKNKYTFKDNEILLNYLPLAFSGIVSMPGDGIKMDIKFKALKTEFKHILSLIPAVYTSDFKGLKTSGKMALDGFVKGVYKDNSMPAFKINLMVEDGEFHYPSLPQAVKNVQVKLLASNPDGVPDHTVIDLSKFHAELGGEPIDATLKMKTPISDPEIDATIKGRINLAKVSDFMELEGVSDLKGNVIVDLIMKGKMSDIERKRYEKFDASGKIDMTQVEYISSDWPDGIRIKKMLLLFNPKTVNLKSFDAKIGSSDIKATGYLKNFIAHILKDDVLKGDLSIDSKLLNLNEMMSDGGQQGSGGGGVSGGSGGSGGDTQLNVFELPDNVEFNMIANIKELIYDNMKMRDVLARMVLKDQVLNISDLRMKTLGGSIIMNGAYSTLNRHRPKVNFNMVLKNLDISRSYETFVTIQKFAPIAQFTKGTFSSKLSIDGFLKDDMMPELSTLNGKGSLTILNAIIKNFKPIVAVSEAIHIDKYKQLNIGEIRPSFKIKNGRLYIDPFDLLMGKTALNISGSNGIDQSLDYLMNFEIPKSELGSSYNSVMNKLIGQAKDKGIDIPQSDVLKLAVLMGGTILAPIIGTSFSEEGKTTKEVVKEIIEDKIEETKEEVKEIIEDKIDEGKEEAKKKAREQADKILKEAEIQSKKIRDAAKKAADKFKKEGYAKADLIEKKATNPITKIAAKEAANKLRKETDKKAKLIIDKGDAEADKILKVAKKKADDLLK